LLVDEHANQDMAIRDKGTTLYVVFMDLGILESMVVPELKSYLPIPALALPGRGWILVLITVPDCVAQSARINSGLPEFYCRDMHRKKFESFAHVIDRKIAVECIFALPITRPTASASGSSACRSREAPQKDRE
jgi:hypothetical protein